MRTRASGLRAPTKIVLGFSTMIALLVSVGAVGYFTSQRLSDNVSEIYETRLPAIVTVVELDRDLQQVLVAERSLIFADPSSDSSRALQQEHAARLQAFDRNWERLRTSARSSEERSILAEHDGDRRAWMRLTRQIAQARATETTERDTLALSLIERESRENLESIRDALVRLQRTHLGLAAGEQKEAEVNYSGATSMLLAVVLASVLLGLFLIWNINRGILRMMTGVIRRVGEASELVSSEASQVLASSTHFTSAAEQQAARMQKMSEQLGDLASEDARNSESACSAAESAHGGSRELRANASASFDELDSAIREIRDSSGKIAGIARIIDEISSQTNLLSLNATTEAARAGEHGRGFAVVAAEVRTLAKRSAEAARQIESLIDDNVAKTHHGTQLAEQCGRAFDELGRQQEGAAELLLNVSAGARGQVGRVREIDESLRGIERETRENASRARDSVSASESLQDQAERLRSSVADLTALVGASALSR